MIEVEFLASPCHVLSISGLNPFVRVVDIAPGEIWLPGNVPRVPVRSPGGVVRKGGSSDIPL
jgi:hypothetical protein